MLTTRPLARVALILVLACLASARAQAQTPAPTGSVIFIHPDGASAATWTAARALLVGPDANLHWDLLPHVAVYRGHMSDSLTATSNGGATTHAFGIKVHTTAFGLTAAAEQGGTPILDEQGRSTSVGAQALRRGLRVGLVQSGIASEPGTACFLAAAGSRKDHDDIAAQLVASGAHVLLSGGERFFLPEGVEGVHGPGKRADGRNLIEEARAAGYTIVRTRDELAALSPETDKVLGLFAESSTFNDRPEEVLAQRGLPLYQPDAPTIAEMTEAALAVLSRDGSRFLLVVEEEGTDNFGNNNNAAGVFEAARRADETFGIARAHLAANPDTLIITCADSDGGGLRMVGLPGDEPLPETLPERAGNGAPIDGRAGTGSAPFVAQPDRAGRRLGFYVTWAEGNDVSGGVVVRAEGLNAHLVRGTLDNTAIAELIRLTLFATPNP